MNIRVSLGALGIAMAVSVAPVSAATVSAGSQLDVSGAINHTNSSFVAGGFVDFDPNTTGAVLIATGDFAPFADEVFTFSDLELVAPEQVYTATDAGAGSLAFLITDYLSFDNSAPSLGFEALGQLLLTGFDPTPGLFQLTTQDGRATASFSSTTTVIPLPASALLLLGALSGLGFIGARRRRTAVA